MKNIKNIILDLGGVLINLDYNKVNTKLSELGLSNSFSKAKQIDLIDKLEEGKISERGFIDEFNRIAKTNHTKDIIIDAWNSILLDFPYERLELLELLGKKYRLFLFSNTNSIHIKKVYKILDESYNIKNLDSYFERIYLSNELGIRKPKPEGFEYILKENNLSPYNTLFIDDSPQHITGAKKTGIQCEWLNLEKENLHESLTRLSLI
ncbi:MAG: haloacid dehalogenase [Flavobacteriales bacterium]|nr:haloacid dehalogenase [Flavobacteriales bacterium]MBO72141.1 haloacid dehalogenase [Flavobacteriales bacterium]